MQETERGAFAADWLQERQVGMPHLHRLRRTAQNLGWKWRERFGATFSAPAKGKPCRSEKLHGTSWRRAIRSAAVWGFPGTPPRVSTDWRIQHPGYALVVCYLTSAKHEQF
jgi:hypothetical protein